MSGNILNRLLISFLVILSLSFLLNACGTQAKKHKSVYAKNSKEALKNIKPLNYDYTWFQGKAAAGFRSGLISQDFNVNLRMLRHQCIWASLTGPLSIEGARLYVSPDTLRVIDRLNRKFYEESFSVLRSRFNVPLSFDQLQDILVGNLIKDSDLKGIFESGEDFMTLSHRTQEADITFYLHPKNYTLDKYRLKDRVDQRELVIKFADYTEIDGKPFADHRDILVNSIHESALLNLDFQKAVFGATQEFPYVVGENYEKAHF